MIFFQNILGIAFGEIDISPFLLSFILFLTFFVFLSVLISTAKLIQSLVNDTD